MEEPFDKCRAYDHTAVFKGPYLVKFGDFDMAGEANIVNNLYQIAAFGAGGKILKPQRDGVLAMHTPKARGS